jgi:hypothetical protein
VNSVVSVNVGLPRDVEWQGKLVHTAVWKKPVPSRVMARRLQLSESVPQWLKPSRPGYLRHSRKPPLSVVFITLGEPQAHEDTAEAVPLVKTRFPIWVKPFRSSRPLFRIWVKPCRSSGASFPSG